MTTERKINNLDDLRREREIVRGQIEAQEVILKEHYAHFSERLQPVMRIINFVSGNRIFKKGKNEEADHEADWPSILMKIFLAGGIGGLFLKNSKKNFMRTVLAFALDQGSKFLKEKDLSVYIEKIKSWLSNMKKNKDDEQTEESASE